MAIGVDQGADALVHGPALDTRTDPSVDLSVIEPTSDVDKESAVTKEEPAAVDKEEPASTEVEAAVEPWLRFRVGNLGTANHRSRREFSAVYHVTHINQALRIVEDGNIRASLIRDKSKLNVNRSCVVWVSPNDWTDGYLYGNIRFRIPWTELVRGKKYYWVETMPYRPIACRILVSNENHKDLKPYDPTTGEGPWIIQNERHYFNSEYCLEILMESDIAFSQVTSVDFVEHHQKYCAMNESKLASLCVESKESASYIGAVFVAYLISRGFNVKLPGFTSDVGGVQAPSENLRSALIALRRYFDNIACSDWGTFQADHPCAPALARAAISAFDEDAMRIRSLFVNAAAFDEILGDVLAEAIGVSRDSID